MKTQPITGEQTAEGEEPGGSRGRTKRSLSAQVKRRGLLAAAIALGAGAFGRLSGAGRAEAADGGNMIIGQNNIETSFTQLFVGNPVLGFGVFANTAAPTPLSAAPRTTNFDIILILK